MQSDQSQSCFSSSFSQRTIMRMHICMHGRQTGGREIKLSAISILASFLLQYIYTTLNKPLTTF